MEGRDARAEGNLYARLSAMMFLEFAVWGAWSVMIAVHMASTLHFTGVQIGLVFGTTAIGAILAPMIAGNIADRFMPSQIYTAWAHLLGAVLLFAAWKVTTFPALYGVMLLYSLTYMPTIALTNGIAFTHMGNSQRFGQIRVWGTIGWIVVQFIVGGYLHTADQGSTQSHAGACLAIAAIAAALMGVYSFTLPNTPPSREAKNPYAFLEAFSLVRNRNFAVLLAVSFVVAVELPWYYNLTPIFFTEAPTVEQAAQQWTQQAAEAAAKAGVPAPATVPLAPAPSVRVGGLGLNEAGTQIATTIGQFGEILFMILLLPMLLKAGMRWTIFVGILAWPLRYLAFAVGHPTWLVLASQALHGAAYTFFFAAGMVAAERLAPRDIRASAQSLLLFATNGCGMLVGHFLSGRIDDLNRHPVIGAFTAGGKELVPPVALHNWPGVFLLPIVVTTVAAVLFYALFNERRFQEDAARLHAEEHGPDEQPV